MQGSAVKPLPTDEILKRTQDLSGNREEVPQAVNGSFHYTEGKLVQLLRKYFQNHAQVVVFRCC